MAEYGHGARPGKVVRVYVANGIRCVAVALDDMPWILCPRTCWASNVFTNRADAEKAAE